MTMRTLKLLLLAGIVALLAACGGNGDDDGDDDTQAGADGITVVATEYAFDPETVELAADSAVEITLVNEGIVEHDWTIDELDVQIYTAAGESATGTVNASAGTYEVYCSIPGHRDLGMEGALTVG